jgi:hypothetical protein
VSVPVCCTNLLFDQITRSIPASLAVTGSSEQLVVCFEGDGLHETGSSNAPTRFKKIVCMRCAHLTSLGKSLSNVCLGLTLRPPAPQTCSKCNEEKPKSEFYASKYLSSGLHSQCKRCVRAGQEKRVRCNPEQAATEKTCRCAERGPPVEPPVNCLPISRVQPGAGRHGADLPVRQRRPSHRCLQSCPGTSYLQAFQSSSSKCVRGCPEARWRL